LSGKNKTKLFGLDRNPDAWGEQRKIARIKGLNQKTKK